MFKRLFKTNSYDVVPHDVFLCLESSEVVKDIVQEVVHELVQEAVQEAAQEVVQEAFQYTVCEHLGVA